MPAVSQAQRGYLNAHFGHAWVKKHHFDNKGHLPAHASGRGGLKPLDTGNTKAPPVDEALWNECQRVAPKQAAKQLPQYLGAIHDGKEQVHVHMIDGDKAMREHDMDFESGGNGAEDPKLCPKNHIVLDSNLHQREFPFILYHEAHERRDMVHKGMSYDTAHVRANHGEKQLRMRYANQSR